MAVPSAGSFSFMSRPAMRSGDDRTTGRRAAIVRWADRGAQDCARGAAAARASSSFAADSFISTGWSNARRSGGCLTSTRIRFPIPIRVAWPFSLFLLFSHP